MVRLSQKVLKRDMTSKMKKEGGKIFNAPSKKVGTNEKSLDEVHQKRLCKNEDENQKNGY